MENVPIAVKWKGPYMNDARVNSLRIKAKNEQGLCLEKDTLHTPCVLLVSLHCACMIFALLLIWVAKQLLNSVF